MTLYMPFSNIYFLMDFISLLFLNLIKWDKIHMKWIINISYTKCITNFSLKEFITLLLHIFTDHFPQRNHIIIQEALNTPSFVMNGILLYFRACRILDIAIKINEYSSSSFGKRYKKYQHYF